MAKQVNDEGCLVYKVPEAGKLLGLTKNASYLAAKRGDIPTVRIGKLIRVPKAAFHAMIDAAGAAPQAAEPSQPSGARRG